MQSSTLRTSGQIEDLVRESCGHVSPNNLRVFEHAIEIQGGTVNENGGFRVEAETTTVPACLPDEQEVRIVGRLPSAGDTITEYAQTDLSLADQQVEAARPWRRRDDLSEIAMLNMVPRANFTGHFVTMEPQPDIPWQFLPSGDDLDVAQVFGNRFNAAQVDPQDRSRIAYEGFAVANELILGGVDPTATRSGLETALQGMGTQEVSRIIRDVNRAIAAEQDVPRVREVPLWGSICQSNPAYCSEEASGAFLYLESPDAEIFRMLNPSQRVNADYGIFANVPMLTAERIDPTAQIPVAAGMDVPDEVALEEIEETPPPKLTLFLNVFDKVDGEGTNRCGEGALINWETEAFQSVFRNAVLEAIERKKSLSETPNRTELMVLDGGFARFEAERFAGADWSMVPARTHHANAESMTGMSESMFEKLTHGTAVTSLAMGGPGLMDLLGSDTLPITVSSRPIYREKVQAGKVVYELVASVPDVARNYGAHIVNMSFGTRDENEARLKELRETLLNSTGALLVVAAGNLGNNDRPRGQSVRKAGLTPQMWGDAGHGGGWNILVVAGSDVASDPQKLAWFSNFGEDAVLLAAPGCRVSAVKPTLEGTYEVESFNGTSFAAPIVSYVAAAVRTVLPRGRMSSPWIRARLLASADIDPAIEQAKVGFGRVLNPIAAMQVYDDIVTLHPAEPDAEPVRYVGRITALSASDDISTVSLCEDGHAEKRVLLRFFLVPDSDDDGEPEGWTDTMGPNSLMSTDECRLKPSGTLVIETESRPETVRFEDVADIKFAFNRGIE